MNKNFEIYKDKGSVLAIVVRNNFRTKGNYFFTEKNSPQQLAYVSHRKGKIIQPHIHNKFKRVITYTQEIDILKKGEIKLYLYTNAGRFFKSLTLKGGDLIFFASGGHAYKVIKKIDLILIKQGPYAGEKDKTYLTGCELK